ncbi:hypothetical protein MTR67_001571 [Solanum verrucosum]|uniref:Tf2-1-like SH3-like domain-containing protein n=1 Tax=Solanum verrucosum TaxID=315347 RepID=A0AAF0PT08_SOLVR|nr:hypothetical protein MTR67_001571 [Solanum verrucosum]
MNTPKFLGSQVGEDPHSSIDEVKEIFGVMQVIGNDRVDLASHQLMDVSHIRFTQWKENRGSVALAEEEMKELSNDVHQFARLRICLMSISYDGVIVQNGLESSLVVEKVEVFSQGGDGVLRYQGRLCVPKEFFWWNGMKRDITYFMAKCPNYRQVKVEHQKPGGMTQEIYIPTWKWEMINMHFITAVDYAKIYINVIVRLHRVPLSIISNRGPQFTSHFRKSFQKGLSTQMDPYEELYGRRCRYPVGWFEVDVRRRDLEFQIEDWVFLKVSPMKGLVRFGKTGKLSPRYVGPYKILKMVGTVAYELELPAELGAVYPVFHISLLKKCVGDPTSIVPLESVPVKDSLTYEDVPVQIIDHHVRRLSDKEVASVKVLWRSQLVKGATWEAETTMKVKYPQLFPSDSIPASGFFEDECSQEGDILTPRKPNLGKYSRKKPVHEAIEKVQLIRERLRMTQSWEKLYADVRRRDLEFDVYDWVYLKISPMKGVMRLGKKGKISPRYVGPYQILRCVGKVAYELDFSNELASVHQVFHVSMLKKCFGDLTSIFSLDGLGVDESLSYEDVPVEILVRPVKKLRNKEVASVKVLWRNHLVEGATLEAEADMMS